MRGPSTGATVALDVPTVVGREGDLRVLDPTVSRRHVELSPAGSKVHVTDLGSRSGTLLDDAPVGDASANPGATIRVGATSLMILRLARWPSVPASPSLRVRDDGRERLIAVNDGFSIGRDATCDLHIDHPTVSRHHARITLDAGHAEIQDLSSANGTRVDGRRVGRAVLSDRVAIELGTAPAQITFEEAGRTAAVTVRVGVEGSPHRETVTIEAGTEATVAQVTRDLAPLVGAPAGAVLLYRLDDGALLHPDDQWSATSMQPGDELVLGSGDATAFSAAPVAVVPRRNARTLNQLPRTVWPEPAHVVERIDPPEPTSLRGRGILWQLIGGLGAVAVGLTLVLVNPDYAVFGIITGSIGIISIAASILGDQSRRRHRVKEFRRRLADLDDQLGRARARQAAALHQLSPTVDDIAVWLSTGSPRIWERRPQDVDALRPTIGIGSRAARVEAERARSSSPLAGELDAVLARHRRLDGVPVLGPGPDVGSVGVAGASDRVRSLLARIVVEAAVLHPPDQLRIWVASSAPGWEWCRWMPHVARDGVTSSAADAAALLTEAGRDRADDGGSVLHLVVVPDPPRRLDVDVGALAGRGRLLVVGASDERDLPNGLAALIQVHSTGRATVTGRFPDAPLDDIDIASIEEPTAERFAIALGRLGSGGAHVAPTGLVELLGLGSAASPEVERAWSSPPADRLTVAVGSDDTGSPVTIGFRRDGPHGMIAGTTGSGKSELLQTVLTGLALRHSPDLLNYFLIDFKGGSTFAPLASLPHVVGLVTDLEHDASLATRALTSLDAEIDRRKRVLEAARAPDVIAYARLGGDGPPLPDLLVVIDEFALLVERQPDVREKLDTIATQGRSLGVHMLLATQSPSGVVTHAIRTNTNLWICLRVVTESESTEILGAKDAARIPDGSPGRAIIRLGAGHELRSFQAARIARPVPDDDAPVRITVVGRAGDGPAVGASNRTELDVVVERMCSVWAAGGRRPADPLWLPPLPNQLPAAAVADADRPTDRLVAVLGVADHPREHSQVAAQIDLSTSGHGLVTGAFGFGKTTALTQIACDLALHRSPSEVHIYAVDSGGGSLASLGQLAHVGDVVGASDIERVTRLVERLTREIDVRRERLVTAATGDFVRWRRAGGSAPWIVLLVDDFPAFREVAEQVEMGRLLDRFNSILQHGAAVGVHVVVATAQTTDLRSRELNLMGAKLMLRAADASQYALVDARLGTSPPPLPPGRGLMAGAVEVQVCDPDLTAAATVAARWRRDTHEAWPPPIRRLPTSVTRKDLPASEHGLLLGVGGPDVEPVVLDDRSGSLVLLVAGPSQSGRSTVLAGLLTALEPSAASTLVLSPRPGPLREAAAAAQLPVHTGLTGADAAIDEFLARASRHRVLVIDDAEAICNAPGVGHRLEPLLRDAAETETTVLVAARVSDLPGMFDPWARYLLSLRRAVLLQPTVDDAFLFGAKLPPIPPPVVPGRGILVDRNVVTVVQVAAP